MECGNVTQARRMTNLCPGNRVRYRRSLGISVQSYYRQRSEYGGMKLAQIKCLRELEKENGIVSVDVEKLR